MKISRERIEEIGFYVDTHNFNTRVKMRDLLAAIDERDEKIAHMLGHIEVEKCPCGQAAKELLRGSKWERK